MAIYHCGIKIIGRSDGKSAVASSTYRSGEKLTDDRTGLTHDFTKKRGVVFTEVSLPAHTPPEYADRNVLWNAVEKAEKKSNAQLAREIEVALALCIVSITFALIAEMCIPLDINMVSWWICFSVGLILLYHHCYKSRYQPVKGVLPRAGFICSWKLPVQMSKLEILRHTFINCVISSAMSVLLLNCSFNNFNNCFFSFHIFILL